MKKGLRLAGVPESFAGGEFVDRNRLPADEVHSLVFGHRLSGRNLYSGSERTASFAADGGVSASGDWNWISGRVAKVIGQQLCFQGKDQAGADCVTVLRNPGGTKQNQNEFIWYDRNGALTFSQAD